MNDNKKENSNKYAQLLAISSQMTGSIVSLAAIGYFLDQHYEVKENYFTLGLTLLGVFVGLYLLMKGIKNLNS